MPTATAPARGNSSGPAIRSRTGTVVGAIGGCPLGPGLEHPLAAGGEHRSRPIDEHGLVGDEAEHEHVPASAHREGPDALAGGRLTGRAGLDGGFVVDEDVGVTSPEVDRGDERQRKAADARPTVPMTPSWVTP